MGIFFVKSLAVRLDSFVNLLIPINTEGVLRETDSREKPSNRGLKHGAYSTWKYNDAGWITWVCEALERWRAMSLSEWYQVTQNHVVDRGVHS